MLVVTLCNTDVREQREGIISEYYQKMEPILGDRQRQFDDKEDSPSAASCHVYHCSSLPHGSSPHYPNGSLRPV